MTLQDVTQLLDALTPDELRMVRGYIDRRLGDFPAALTPAERGARLNEIYAALRDQIREGLSEIDLEELEAGRTPTTP